MRLEKWESLGLQDFISRIRSQDLFHGPSEVSGRLYIRSEGILYSFLEDDSGCYDISEEVLSISVGSKGNARQPMMEKNG